MRFCAWLTERPRTRSGAVENGRVLPGLPAQPRAVDRAPRTHRGRRAAVPRRGRRRGDDGRGPRLCVARLAARGRRRAGADHVHEPARGQRRRGHADPGTT